MSEAVTITRVFDVPPEKLWQAWTDPTIISQWFSADPPLSITVLELDPRQNGRFRLAFHHTNGQPVPGEYIGTYLTIQPPHRLTFRVEDSTLTGNAQDSTATFDVRFEPVAQQTRLTLTATHLPAESEGMTIRDWNTCFDNLIQTFITQQEVTT